MSLPVIEEAHEYVNCKHCRDCQRAYKRKYDQTPERKEYDRRRNQTPEWKEYDRKRNQTPERKEAKAKWERQRWQCMGKGVHLARVQDWTESFATLANDPERVIAAHVLMFFADVDDAARAVVGDPSFDYNVLADLIER